MPPLELEIFGIDHSARFQAFKSDLVDALESSGITYTIEDITEIHKFIELGLESVPSVRVGRTRMFSLTDENSSQVISSVLDYIQEHLSRILVPVDFSEGSLQALNYACGLAAGIDAHIDVVHVYHPVVDPHNAVIVDTDTGKYAQEKLDEIVSQKEAEYGSSIQRVSAILELGYPLPSIVEMSKDDNVEMIVLGTRGKSNVLDKLLGTVSSSVAQKAFKPVLLVPPDYVYSGYKKLVVAFDEELVTGNALSQLMTFNRKFLAHIDFVHVTENDDREFLQMRDRLMERLFENGTPEMSFDIKQVAAQDGSVANELESYCQETNPDLLVLIARHRNFIQNIFHQSVSRNVCLHAHSPLLVIHTD